ncbi:MAG: hypothetical protein IJS53_02055 [Clostridia bacterium]|nr:hypothetical protein [Clostridia bacterium]
MSTLDTLTVRFEADAADLLGSLDDVDRRLKALRDQRTIPLTLAGQIETRLTVAADEAISRALSGAGERLSQAVEGHEAAFGQALAAAEQAMGAALQSAVRSLQNSVNITIPLYVDGARLTTAVVRGLRQQTLTQGETAF